MNYGEIPLAPFIFQDDVIHAVGGLDEAIRANEKTDRAVKKLNLSLNQDKTTFLIIGSRKQKLDVLKELEEKPLMCGEFKTQMKPCFKWLGQTLSEGGLSESVSATVESRLGKIRGACLEIAQIINDWRSQAIGGMDTALLLWESCCIPSLLHGAGTWTDILKITERKLNQLQSWFCRLILQVGQGAPLVSMSWDLNLLDMSLRVMIEKVMLVLYIRNLEEDTLARKIYESRRNTVGLD